MNNHPGYPSPGFPSYGRRPQISSDLPVRGSQRLLNSDVQEFSRNERRQTFSSEETNSYRPGPRQHRLSRDDLFSGGRLSQIDRRTLLQSAPRTNFLNESLSHSYSSANKLDSQTHAFSSPKQNLATLKFDRESEYSNLRRNEFSKEDVSYDNLPSSGLLSNMQKFGREFAYEKEQSYSDSRSNFNKMLSSPVYSKNASFTNRTFSEEQSPDTGFSRNRLSSGVSYFEDHNVKQQDLHKQVEEIQRVLEEQRRMRENDERVEEIQKILEEQRRLREQGERVSESFPTTTIPLSAPTNVESDSLNNLQSMQNSYSNQILAEQMSWYKNTMLQSETPNKPQMFHSESSQTLDSKFPREFPPYSQPTGNKTHGFHNSGVINFRNSEHWNNLLESQNTCATPEKMAVQDSSHKLSSDFTDSRSCKLITTTIAGTTSPSTISVADNAVPLKVDGEVNLDKLPTKEIFSENSQNCSNENSFQSNTLPETSNLETNVPLHEESFNSNSLDKNFELSASFLTIPPEHLPLKEWTACRSSEDISNKSFESKIGSSVLDKSVPTGKQLNTGQLHLDNSSSELNETSKEHSVIPDEKVSSTEWSTPVSLSLEDNLNKCLEIMKTYSPILIKKDGLKSESLPTESNSNECFETTNKNSEAPVDKISSNESSNSAPIPFLYEASGTQSTTNVNVKPTDDLSQDSVASNAPSSNSVMTGSREVSTNKSALEDALTTLDINSPVVGLDYIVEDKSSLAVDGRFPFKCKLCNSSIARTLILDHIQGSKHRLRYLKTNDEAIYDRIMHQKDKDKDVLICEAAAEMEQKYGRGRVVVLFNSPIKVMQKVPAMNICKVSHDLTDVDFESSYKSDLKNLETDSVVKTKQEKQVTSTLPESVIKVEDESSMSSVISSHSASLPNQNLDNEKKDLKIIVGNKIEKAAGAEEVIEDVKIDKQSDIKCEFTPYTQKQISEVADSSLAERCSSGNSTLKRSSPLCDDTAYKNVKKPHVEALNMDWNTSADFYFRSNSEPSLNKDMIAEQTAKSNVLNSLMLEQLSKCEISSEDEASIVLQTVDVLLKLLLRYKLKDSDNIDIENLMRSLHNKSSEEISKILGCSKGNVSDDSVMKEETLTVVSKDNSYTQSGIPNNSKLLSEDNALKSHQTANQNLCENNSHGTNTQNFGSSKQDPKSGLTSPVINASSSSTSQLLQPPPFFSWPASSNVTTTVGHSSVTPAHTAQNNMTWSSAYQSHVAYYQQHGYTVPTLYQPYGIPMIPSVPSASVSLVAPVMAPTIMPPLPPSCGGISAPFPPPPPPPPPPSEPPPLPK